MTTPKTREHQEEVHEGEEEEQYVVVINGEAQYSIWPADRDLPPGWAGEGTRGAKSDCLARIGEVWTDPRPRSLREHLARHDQ
ncbi:MbtH family NRPS accessory protein [Streptomyces sp. NBC_00237]|uniref:MbtH family protein n=1 Tax=Streptomyces sp. NBC_00237 TaxID=2975687 RepID=UPI002251464F|nr:MbtH family NRPS accessory protein [Streptomyces sp. NBC_00237]MCX5205601.1 MbtH family NRPS accessory protein [Streptomyces sp. NBC_00237]